jgi:acetyl esterase/lipase
VRRRELLSLGGALCVSQTVARSATQPPPSPPTTLPRAWEEAESIPLWPKGAPGAAQFVPRPVTGNNSPVFVHNVSSPSLRVFRPARPNGRALLVVPGGSYTFVSISNEGVDVAARITPSGVTVFVLTYRLPGNGWTHRSDVPLQDAQRAMRVIRANAGGFGIDARKVSVLGFSAGGHLAATLATEHSAPSYSPVDEMDPLSARPETAGLIYPVITMEAPVTHEISRSMLLGDSPSAADVERRSAERHVDANTPPTFIVHAFDDSAVSVENALRFLNAMRAAKRPVEAHLLQSGGHAFGVGQPKTSSATWPAAFLAWLETSQ